MWKDTHGLEGTLGKFGSLRNEYVETIVKPLRCEPREQIWAEKSDASASLRRARTSRAGVEPGPGRVLKNAVGSLARIETMAAGRSKSRLRAKAYGRGERYGTVSASSGCNPRAATTKPKCCPRCGPGAKAEKDKSYRCPQCNRAIKPRVQKRPDFYLPWVRLARGAAADRRTRRRWRWRWRVTGYR